MGVRYERLTAQAQEALSQGREDLARTALERRFLLERQVATVRDQHAALLQQQAQLQENERRLAERVATFRTEKETIKATYTASEAQVRANEAAAGLGSYMSDVGANLNRAKDRVAQMQARAAATDELLASGALENIAWAARCRPRTATVRRSGENGGRATTPGDQEFWIVETGP